MQVNSLRHVSSANGLFLEEEKEEKAEEEEYQYLLKMSFDSIIRE